MAKDTDTATPATVPVERRSDATLRAPTHDEVVAACIAFRGDYGALSPDAQDALREEALEWLLVWRHVSGRCSTPPWTNTPPGAMVRVRLAHPAGVYRSGGAGARRGCGDRVFNGALGTVIGAQADAGTLYVHFDALNAPVQLPSDWVEPAPSCSTVIIGYFDANGRYVAHDRPIPVTRVGQSLCDDAGDTRAIVDCRGEWVRPLEWVAGIKLTVLVRDTYPAPPSAS